ncbi:MFS transporter [Streptomyces smyrnaeus]|uniref:MFS transporter n=1 Tax=Streptomyces TaxID=1883 RepID=UPI000C1A5FD4|nr:MFS transporter [Streptomyces sp. B15]MBQ1123326.1 MFS transporter [Streptomyces sp. B15]MBQ1162512.1 MFS transporter [Streptomyces sp. A73]
MPALDRQDEPVTSAPAAATSAAPRTAGRLRYLILAMLFTVTTINYADRSTLSIAGDSMQKDLHISSGELGVLFSAFSWSYLIAQIPGGWLLDRYGSKKVYGAAIFLWSVFTMAQGAIGFFAGAAVVLLFILRFVVGLAEAPSFPGNSRIVAAWFPTKERGLAAALFNSAQYFATVAFAPLMGWLVVTMGWEHVFTVIGGLGVVLALVWTRVIHPPRSHPRLKRTELEHIAAGGAVVDMDAPTPRETTRAEAATTGRQNLAHIKAMLRNRTMFGVFVGQYFINTITWFFLTWFPVYLVQDRGMTILEAGFVSSLPALCGFTGGVLGGFLSDQLARRGLSLTTARKIPVITGLLLSTTILICNYVSASWLVVLIMSLAFFGKGLGALGWAVMSDVSPKQIAGLAGGVFNTFGALAGILTPLVIGYLIDATGSFDLALVFVSACAAMAVVSYLVIVKDIRRMELTEL